MIDINDILFQNTILKRLEKLAHCFIIKILKKNILFEALIK